MCYGINVVNRKDQTDECVVNTVDSDSDMSVYILSYIYTYLTYSNTHPNVVRMGELTSHYD